MMSCLPFMQNPKHSIKFATIYFVIHEFMDNGLNPKR